MSDANLFLETQQAAQARLKSHDFFSNIEVLVEDKGDVVSLLEQELQKQGLAVLVSTPTALANFANIPGPYFTDINLLVTIYESLELNRRAEGTQKVASLVAQYVVILLHHHQPDGLGLFTLRAGEAIESFFDKGLLIWQVSFRSHGGIELS